MENLDMNLLSALDALLTAGSVTGAARRLGLSTSAMSRTLTRLRAATGDPLLVRAGRGLVPTPRAAELRGRVNGLAREVQAVLSPRADELDLASLERTFTIRSNEGFVAVFSTALVAAVRQAAPRVRLRFAPKPVKDAEPLREGQIDLEIGVLGEFAPEVKTHFLFRDHFVGVVRAGHALLAEAVTPKRYAACRHVVVSRMGKFAGPVDHALEERSLERDVVVVVPGFLDALRIARHSDLVALVPSWCVGGDLISGEPFIQGLVSFALPVRTPKIAVLAMWHPRVDADPAHRWFRNTVVRVCRTAQNTPLPPISKAG
jgi:DNA-binding transcriptional LysR family regulator